MPFLADASYVGVAKEATPMTAVVPTAYPIVEKWDVDSKVNRALDSGLRSSLPKSFDSAVTTQYAEINAGGNVHLDSIGWMLTSILGSIATVGASNPFTHTISALNSGAQPGSQTWTDWDGVQAWSYAGTKWTDLSFSYGPDEFIKWDGKAIAAKEATAATPTPSFPTVAATPAWKTVLTLGGSAAAMISALQVDIKRSGKPIHTVNNTQDPYAVFVGGDLEVNVKATLVYENATFYSTNYKTGTKTSLVVASTLGTASLTHTMTSLDVLSAKKNRSSGNYVELETELIALGNSTDVGASAGFGNIKTVLVNAIAASTYA